MLNYLVDRKKSINFGWFGKFLPQMLLFFLISLIYNLLRPMKIAMVISAKESGAEIIPSLKLFGMLPAAFLFTYAFTKLSSHMKLSRVFYTFLTIFLFFFIFFILVLFPNRTLIEPTSLCDWLQSILPLGFKGLIAMIRYWHLSLFYLFSELWGTVILSMLFWGYINEVTPVNDAKRFYGIFAFGANLAAMLGGQINLIFSRMGGEGAWDTTANSIVGAVIVCGLLIYFTFYYLDSRTVARMPKTAQNKDLNSIQKTSLKEAFSYILKSKHLLYLALVVLFYNLVFNLTDVLWNHQVRLKYTDSAADINTYMSQVTVIKGLIAAIFALFVTSNIIKRFGWLFTALITPTIMFVTSLFFFPLIIFDSTTWIGVLEVFFDTPLLTMSVFLGGMQNSLTRASKYSFFDATKELAFLPLTSSERRKGKAVIDGIGSRVGKSGGSLILWIMAILFGSISATVPYISGLIVVLVLMWIAVIYGLSLEIKKKSQSL